MADNEHLSLIDQGVETWNLWRVNNPGTRPDLGGADLSSANLAGFDFSKADLSGANLSQADLGRANLSGAVLSEANLGQANLNGAFLNRTFLFESDLSGADLSRTDLSKVFLSKANLIAADLSGADIREADLSEAVVGWTIFNNVDLGQVKGLQKVYHQGPSIIGLETIYKSGGNIPEQFFRGVGLPDHFIDYIKSIAAEPVGYHSAFIGYSSEDEAFASKLFASLQSENVRTWYAPLDLKIGARFRQKIEESIRLHDRLLLILSEHALHNDWVAQLVETALAKESDGVNNVLFPVFLDKAVLEDETEWPAPLKKAQHTSDFSRWEEPDAYQEALGHLLGGLKAAGNQESEN